jgi:predicted outer membrane repeat protein
MSNTARRAGGIRGDDDSKLYVTSSEIRGNTSTGYGGGGGIDIVDGTLHVTASIIADNKTLWADGGDGGGILFFQRIANPPPHFMVSDSLFEDNYASGYGGGIYTNGDWGSVTNSTFRGNYADYGGGMYAGWVDDHILISDSRFEDNDARYRGGGLGLRESEGTIQGTVFYANDEGAVYSTDNSSGVTIQDCIFAENYGHGAIYNYASNMHITGTLFTMNSGDYGAIRSFFGADLTIQSTTFYSNTSGHSGGAIYNVSAAEATIMDTTFTDNFAVEAGGAIFVDGGNVHLTNSTLSSNRAASGGAFFVSKFSNSTFTHVTAYGNQASNSYGGVYLGESADLTMSNSIVAGSIGGVDCAYDSSSGNVFDNGYNIIQDGTCLAEASSLGVNPKLEPLADNGGATQTHALMEDSPAIDMIPANECAVPTDQRGVHRPQGIACDTGAFESGATGFSIFLPLAIK